MDKEKGKNKGRRPLGKRFAPGDRITEEGRVKTKASEDGARHQDLKVRTIRDWFERRKEASASKRGDSKEELKPI